MVTTVDEVEPEQGDDDRERLYAILFVIAGYFTTLAGLAGLFGPYAIVTALGVTVFVLAREKFFEL